MLDWKNQMGAMLACLLACCCICTCDFHYEQTSIHRHAGQVIDSDDYIKRDKQSLVAYKTAHSRTPGTNFPTHYFCKILDEHILHFTCQHITFKGVKFDWYSIGHGTWTTQKSSVSPHCSVQSPKPYITK